MIKISMVSFSDELVKISGVGKVLGFLARHKGKAVVPSVLGAGYVGGKGVEQAGKDFTLGRRVRKQYEERGG